MQKCSSFFHAKITKSWFIYWPCVHTSNKRGAEFAKQAKAYCHVNLNWQIVIPMRRQELGILNKNIASNLKNIKINYPKLLAFKNGHHLKLHWNEQGFCRNFSLDFSVYFCEEWNISMGNIFFKVLLQLGFKIFWKVSFFPLLPQ